jgi:hypothetical protein
MNMEKSDHAQIKYTINKLCIHPITDYLIAL